MRNSALAGAVASFAILYFAQIARPAGPAAPQVVNDGYGDYVYVPAGSFRMGDNFGDSYATFTESRAATFQRFESFVPAEFKELATDDAPYGIRLSPILRHQSGLNFARTGSIVAPAGSGLAVSGNGTGSAATLIYLEPSNANREDNVWVFDTRAEKALKFGGSYQLRLFLDVFNIANSHASETIGRATGLSYLKPTAILAPRTARVGFRFVW